MAEARAVQGGSERERAEVVTCLVVMTAVSSLAGWAGPVLAGVELGDALIFICIFSSCSLSS